MKRSRFSEEQIVYAIRVAGSLLGYLVHPASLVFDGLEGWGLPAKLGSPILKTWR